MSMFYCRGCGKEIHELAETCPSCGVPQNITAPGGGKSKVVAALLALFLGALGIHRFYLGQWWGLFYLLFCWTGIPSLISFIETIVFLLSNKQNWDNKYNDGISSGESSGVVVAILVFVMIFVGIAVIGILAAITIPAYGDYTNRAKVSEMILAGADAKIYIAEYAQANGSLINSGSGLSINTSGKNVGSGSVSADGVITVTGSGIGTGTQPTLTLTPTLDETTGVVTWVCSGSPSKLMPASCRY